MDVSIIIPARDEEESIAKVVKEIKKFLPESEIIVINDGSKDSTEFLAKKAGAKVLNHSIPLGYGASLKEGIRNSSKNLIAIIDGDGTYPCKSFPVLMKEIENSDMVIGARPPTKIPFSRRPIKGILQGLANYLVGRKIPDLNSGMRIMKKEVLAKFLPLLPDGFSFTSTSTLSFLSEGYKVKFVPINYFPRKGRSKISPLRDTTQFFLLILRTVLYFNPLKIFMPLSLLLLSLGIFVLLYSALIVGKVMDITSIVIILTSVQIGIMGVLADLIVRRTNK